VRGKFGRAGVIAFVLSISLFTGPAGLLSRAEATTTADLSTGSANPSGTAAPSTSAAQPSTDTADSSTGTVRPSTGVGSCTLKNWNAGTDPNDAKNLPLGQRPQSYTPDDYNCTGAEFAAPGTEFTKFPQPHDFNVNNLRTVQSVPVCQAGWPATS